MCLQFQRARGRAERTRLLTVRGGYHGDTFGAMAVCDPVGGMHSLFDGVLAEHVFAERPPDGFDARLDERWAAQVRELVERHARRARGDRSSSRSCRARAACASTRPSACALLRELCDEHGLLLVLDEIATGFGRTGALFACEHAGVAPDVMCVGKALTGGYMTLAATLCTRAVADAVSAGEGGGLMHGPTFMANPLACSVALASLDLLRRSAAAGDWHERVRGDRARPARGACAGAGARRACATCACSGAIGVVQLEREVESRRGRRRRGRARRLAAPVPRPRSTRCRRT